MYYAGNMEKIIHGILFCALLQLYAVRGEDESTWRCPNDLPDTTAVFTYRDHCYQFVDNEVYWPAASAYCMRHGGHLVQIHDASTNAFLVRTLNSLPWRNKGVWIGLHDRNGELDWEWVTSSPLVGESLRWTNWARGHPKGLLHGMRDCVRMIRGRRNDWRWHETFCSLLRWKYKFVCQYDATPTTTLPPSTPAILPERRFQYRTESRHVDLISQDHYHDNYRGDTPMRGDTVSMVVSEDEGGVMAAQEMGQSDGSHHQKKLATTVAVTCLIGSLAGIVLLVLLLIRRRRRQTHEEPTLQMDNPTYGDGQDIKVRAANEYAVNVYTNPMELRKQLSLDSPPCKMDFSPLQEKGFSTGLGWDYMNVRQHDYLPMDGAEEPITPSGESLPESHIYEDIPCGSEVDDDDNQVYEVLEDLKEQNQQ